MQRLVLTLRSCLCGFVQDDKSPVKKKQVLVASRILQPCCSDASHMSAHVADFCCCMCIAREETCCQTRSRRGDSRLPTSTHPRDGATTVANQTAT